MESWRSLVESLMEKVTLANMNQLDSVEAGQSIFAIRIGYKGEITG